MNFIIIFVHDFPYVFMHLQYLSPVPKNSTEMVWPLISKMVAGHGGKPGTVQSTTSPITNSLVGASFEILSLRVNFVLFLACSWKEMIKKVLFVIKKPTVVCDK